MSCDNIVSTCMLFITDVVEDFTSAAFRDGSCSLNKYLDCDDRALCIGNEQHTRFRCYCPEGVIGDGYRKENNGTGCDVGKCQDT